MQHQSKKRPATYLIELNDESNGPRFRNVLDKKKEVRHYIYNFIDRYNRDHLKTLLKMQRLRFGKLGLEEFVCAWLCKEVFRINNVKELYLEYRKYYAHKYRLDEERLHKEFPCYEQYVIHINKTFELYNEMENELKTMILGMDHIPNAR